MKDEKHPLPNPQQTEIPVNPVHGEPVDVWDQVNKYGTYEVQDTTDTDNTFPTIGYSGCQSNPGSWKACLEPPDIPPGNQK